MSGNDWDDGYDYDYPPESEWVYSPGKEGVPNFEVGDKVRFNAEWTEREIGSGRYVKDKTYTITSVELLPNHTRRSVGHHQWVVLDNDAENNTVSGAIIEKVVT